MAFGLTDTSRLGCQIIVTDDMDGISFDMPKATRNFYVGECLDTNGVLLLFFRTSFLLFSDLLFNVDGHVPKPH